MDDLLLKEAKSAVEQLFTDTSVDIRETLERMEDIKEQVDMYIEGLEWDLRQE